MRCAAAVSSPAATGDPRADSRQSTRGRSSYRATSARASAKAASTRSASTAAASGADSASPTARILSSTPCAVVSFSIPVTGTPASRSCWSAAGGPASLELSTRSGDSDRMGSAESCRMYPTLGSDASASGG